MLKGVNPAKVVGLIVVGICVVAALVFVAGALLYTGHHAVLASTGS